MAVTFFDAALPATRRAGRMVREREDISDGLVWRLRDSQSTIVNGLEGNESKSTVSHSMARARKIEGWKKEKK
jgi:hypothetical protein